MCQLFAERQTDGIWISIFICRSLKKKKKNVGQEFKLNVNLKFYFFFKGLDVLGKETDYWETILQCEI